MRPADGLQAVLVDLDGTLVDTEPAWFAAEYALVEAHGGTWNDQHAHALVGNALIVSAAYIREHGRVDLPLDDIVDELTDAVVREVRTHVPWRPGARELLAQVRAAGIPCAMVTMSYERLARAVADELPPDTFATLVTGDQVVHGKPHPEPYLTAARRLGADPGHCVAIEDSPTGIASAEAAGCAVLAVPNHVPILPAATRTVRPLLTGLQVDDLEDLLRPRR